MNSKMSSLFLSLLVATLAAVSGWANVVIENDAFRLMVASNAVVRSLVVKASGEELLDAAAETPLFSVTQERPFINEVKLAYPNKRTTFRANRIRREGDSLFAGFELAPYEARIDLKVTPHYIAFTLGGFVVPPHASYHVLQMDAPPVESFRLLQLPIVRRRHFGDWLDVMWDDSAAVAVVAAMPEALIDHERTLRGEMLVADAQRKVRLEGTTAALVATPAKGFLNALEKLEHDFSLPPGVALRRSPALRSSIVRVFDLNPQTVDEHIRWARKGGFRHLQVYYTSIVRDGYPEPPYCRCGDYDYRPEYPRGRADLVAMLAKLKAAGIVTGLHVLPQHIGLRSRYVVPVADRRLRLKDHFTLARALAADASGGELVVDQDPRVAPRHPKCRVLRFGGELMTYEDCVTTRPYRFTGVVRGAFGTTPVAHAVGEIGGVLDISEFGGSSCYVDQETDLQDEINDKIADIYSAGFEFVYFDGAEGVSPPFNFHVGNAQYRLWKKLDPMPIFAEGAAKTHFGWHMLSGANAFDAFPPEVFKRKIDEHPAVEAPQMLDNFTKVNFGWWYFCQPNSKTVGCQVDMWEYGASRAAAWDCPQTISLFSLKLLASHPRADDLYEMLRRWEDVRANQLLTEAEKMELRVLGREHHLYLNEAGRYELHAIEMLPDAPKAPDLRGFVFERNGRRVVAYWHVRGAGEVEVALEGGVRRLKVDRLRYLETDLPLPAVRQAFRAAAVSVMPVALRK